MTDHARAIEAGARAIAELRGAIWTLDKSKPVSATFDYDAAKACIEAAIASGALVPAGKALDTAPASGDYVVVPRKPTEAMIWAGHHQIDWCRNDQATHVPDHHSQTDNGVGTTCKQDICDAWTAMLNAASRTGGAK